jgi:Peptidase family M23
MPRARIVVAVVVAAVVAVVGGSAGPSTAAPLDLPVRYIAPVAGPVVDAFRPPSTPFGPGNRGLEYATTPGTEVHAAADGQVVFAGPVAGNLHVTVLHADGIRTSYSFLADVAVTTGRSVHQGDVVGTAGPRLFFGARVGDEYVDPALLLAAGPVTVHLVPLEPEDVDVADERQALAALASEHRGPVGDAMSWLRGTAAATADVLVGGTSSTASAWRAIAHEIGALDPFRHLAAVVAAVDRWEAARKDCTPPGRAPPAPTGRRIAVLVGGLGSSSVDAAVDTVDTGGLGYAAPDVLRFSYAGGRIPDPTDGFAGIPSAPYTAADSQADLVASAAALADLLGQVASAAPGVPVDVIAHSQGGVVARLALAAMAVPSAGPSAAAAPVLPSLLVTIGTPHGGADLATVVAAAQVSSGGRAALAGLSGLLDLGLEPGSPAVAGLAETSPVVAALAGHPPPDGLAVLSIAARGDVVVPAVRAVLTGAAMAVVPVGGPTAHDRLPATPEVTREIALAIAGLAPTCETLADAVRDAMTAEGISWAEDLLGLAVTATGVAVTGPAPP